MAMILQHSNPVATNYDSIAKDNYDSATTDSYDHNDSSWWNSEGHGSNIHGSIMKASEN